MLLSQAYVNHERALLTFFTFAVPNSSEVDQDVSIFRKEIQTI